MAGFPPIVQEQIDLSTGDFGARILNYRRFPNTPRRD
jgi:hypothetical protein